MRKILFILLFAALCLPMAAGIHSYTDESVLNSGHWVKIRVSESGVCRMSFSQLRSAGIEPTQLRVFGYGGAMLEENLQKKKIDDLPQVPVYVGADYVLFWVQGPISWEYSSRFTHTRNTYSDYGYYFLSDNAGDLLAPEEATAIEGAATDIYSFQAYQVHEKDSLNLIDRGGISGGGQEFYGEQFNPNQKRSFSFLTPNALTGTTSRAYIDLAGYAKIYSYFRSSFNGNNANVAIPPYRDFYDFARDGYIYTSAATQEDRQLIQLTFSNSTSGALGWLNYIELVTPTELKMHGSWMGVRTTTNYRSSLPVRFHLSGASADMQVWDITQRDAIHKMPATITADTLQWVGSQADGIHEYVVFNPQGNQWVSAQIIGEVKNQNLHQLKNIDYVIICPEGYEAIAADLAKAHEAKEGITWAVVTDQQVYNEFSSGTPDATAYRWLMKMLYDRADGNGIAAPRWLLLMGHGTFDNRKLLPNSGTSLLLMYEVKNSINEVSGYATDDYFALLSDSIGYVDTGDKLDIGVGRLPVESTAEARAVVDKLIRYIRNEQTGKWKNQLLFLADDGEGGTHTETSEISAERVRLKNPDFVVNKVFLDAYPQEVNASGESYPLAKNRVDNLLKNGVLFFDYSGHGGYNAITNESILNLKDIENMRNENQAFWLFATCNFAQCDAGRRSSAEAAVLNPNGGAIGVFAATRTVYASQNTELNREVCDTLFGHRNVFHYDATLGEAIKMGKNNRRAEMNKWPYLLLGDPAMRLNYPTDYQVETKTDIGTLNALSVQHVKGQIIDEDGLVVEDFNGEVDITVYDKIQSIPTRDNDATNAEPKVVEYKDYPNKLYSGAVAVKEGQFEYTFMVPKDIRYNFGNGRIVYYARSTDSDVTSEAVGHYEDFIIGGSGSILSTDTTGPEMHIYLNTPAFKDGDRTYATPRFFADLADSSGINTSGAGIGHDLVMIIDDDAKQTYSLNEYFTAANNSYQAGQVSYLMEALPNGQHSLTFRAWDLLNNSTTQTLNFIVEAGIDPSIYSVTTYPNPVQAAGVVNLIVNYDQPDELLQTEVRLYNTSGQVIWSHTQNNPDRVAINLGQLGLPVGIYIYNVRIKSATSGYSTSSGKIIVTNN
jgi:hypothetical protein